VTVLDGNGTPRTVNESLYGNPWTFTGRRLDGETGLMYFRNRMYEVGLGRFCQRDSEGYVDGMSLYAGYFAPNNMDPFGNLCCKGQGGHYSPWWGATSCAAGYVKVPDECCEGTGDPSSDTIKIRKLPPLPPDWEDRVERLLKKNKWSLDSTSHYPKTPEEEAAQRRAQELAGTGLEMFIQGGGLTFDPEHYYTYAQFYWSAVLLPIAGGSQAWRALDTRAAAMLNRLLARNDLVRKVARVVYDSRTWNAVRNARNRGLLNTQGRNWTWEHFFLKQRHVAGLGNPSLLRGFSNSYLNTFLRIPGPLNSSIGNSFLKDLLFKAGVGAGATGSAVGGYELGEELGEQLTEP
jgi:RHS repeat-associated protein